MTEPSISLLPEIREYIDSLDFGSISNERKKELQALVDYGTQKIAANRDVNLNFICTHNSRRSQLSQVWAQTAATCFGLEVHCYSGGVEVTAFNPRAVQSLERVGFRISRKGEQNPIFHIYYSNEANPIYAFSKRYDDKINPKDNFAAVMTCSHAEENCPFIPGTEERITLNYDDPKEYDGTPQEAGKYDERSRQIATEMFYIFSKIKN